MTREEFDSCLKKIKTLYGSNMDFAERVFPELESLYEWASKPRSLGLRYKQPQSRLPEDNVNLLFMLLAGTAEMALAKSKNDKNEILREVITFSEEISRAYHSAVSRKGGKAHGKVTRENFQSDYREVRNRKTEMHKEHIIKELSPYYKDVAVDSTLRTWATEADREDGFVRKPGRPHSK